MLHRTVRIYPPPPENFPLKQPVSAPRLAALLIFALCAFAAPTSYAQTAATVVSVSATDGFYNAGDILPITVEFSEVVTVTGVPRLLVLSSVGGGFANYTSGSGSTMLTYTYDVRSVDDTRDLAYSVAGLLLNGGSIKTGTLNADRTTLPMPGSAMSLSGTSDVVLDSIAPVFPDAASSSDPLVLPTIATSSTAATTVYNAEATDFAGTADTGITYTLGGTGTDPDSFSLAPATGVLTPAANDPAEGTYTLTLTATDEAENVSDTHYLRVVVAALPTVTISDNIAIGTPATRLTDTANSADGALTFTFMFREDVTGFETGDITVTGGSKGGFSTVTTNRVYTLLATPTSGTDGGVLSITVPAGAATGVTTGAGGTARDSVKASHTQAYDTLATVPTIATLVATDNIIDATERGSGVPVTGTNEAGTTKVILCSSPTDATATTCSGTSYMADVTATAWSFTLNTTQITALTPGIVTLTAIATDAAGNIAVSPVRRINVDASLPAGMARDVTLPGGLTGRVTATAAGELHVMEAAANTAAEPSGIVFNLLTDISVLSAANAAVPSTVCLPTTGVPTGVEPILFHLATAAAAWEEIGRDTATYAGFVCGMATTFSPFAVGYEQLTIEDARLSAISRTILPEVARAITDTTVSAIARRLHHAGADSRDSGSVTLGGQSTLADILTTGGQALADGTLNLHDMVGRSAFVLPLNQAGDLVKGLTLWGGGDYRAIGGNGDATDWDGALFSARLGADARVRNNLLTGAALSWTQGDFEYGALADDPTAGGGDYTLRMTSLTPYVGWSVVPAGGLDVWATAGYGWGEVSITDTIVDARQTSDATTVMVGGGVSAQVLKTRTSRVRVKGELMQTSMDLDGHDRLGALTVEARRARLQVEGRHEHELAGGGRLGGTLEAGLRRDGGDGLTGTGAEMGGGVQYRHPAQGVTLSGQGRVLLGHTSNYEDWGIGAALTVIPGQGGEGLALRLSPTYGQTVTNTAQLWDQSAANLTGTDAAVVGQRMNAEVGYGLAIADGQSLLTPYGKLTWGAGTRDYRLGSRLTLASGLNLSLESRRGETSGAAVDHGVLLNVVWGW